MKFNLKFRRYKNGEDRIIKRFAFLPKICSSNFGSHAKIEVRWMELVYIKQRFNPTWLGSSWKDSVFVP